MIKLLKYDGDWIISTIEEIEDVEYGEPDCVLKYPCFIANLDLSYYPNFSADREIIVRSSNITVMTEPNLRLLNTYKAFIENE